MRRGAATGSAAGRSPEPARRSWRESVRALAHPRVVTMLFLGFSAGLPLWLIFSTLSLWLREAEVSRSAVTMFSWAALGYSFKFVWAPLVDQLPVPGLCRRLGQRRGWLLLAQTLVIAAIVGMALTDPANNLTAMALAAVMLGFSSATQDIVVDAYRIESADEDLQALLSATYIAGYRIGMLAAGAGALKLAEALGTTGELYLYPAWRSTYLTMAALMLIGVATTLLIAEPARRGAAVRAGPAAAGRYAATDYLRFLLLFALTITAFIGAYILSGGAAAGTALALERTGWSPASSGFLGVLARLACALALAALVAGCGVRLGVAPRPMVRDIYLEPVLDFFRRYRGAALLILLLIGSYRTSDIVLGVVANVFYQDLGFSKDQIAEVTKLFGLLMTVVGGFVGGLLALRFGVMRILLLGALLAALTNLLFVLLAETGPDIRLLVLVIGADNLSAGIASAAFVAYLSSLTSVSFTAMQYAVFSSLMTLFPKLLGGYSGSIVDALGYERFFLLTAVLGLPVLLLVWLAGRRLD